MKNLFRLIKNRRGFTLVELAIVMVVVGLLAGGGIPLMRMLTERKARNEGVDYLNQVKEAILTYAQIYGVLPTADTNGDGVQDSSATSGHIPYITLGVKPRDSWNRYLTYAINANLYTDKTTSCSTLMNDLTGTPLVVDADGAPTAFSVAAILVSSGPKDADGDDNEFDAITGSPQGDNTDGSPNYIRHLPTSTFDDLVIYIGRLELFSEIGCTGTDPSTDPCYDDGITVENQYGQEISYKKNGTACKKWDAGDDLKVVDGDSYEIFKGKGCNSGDHLQDIEYSNLKDADADADCEVAIDSDGDVVDR